MPQYMTGRQRSTRSSTLNQLSTGVGMVVGLGGGYHHHHYHHHHRHHLHLHQNQNLHLDQRNHQTKLLRAATPEELEQWSDTSSDVSYFNSDVLDLDEGRPYTFRRGEQVWVRTTHGKWCLGTVTGSPPRVGPTREGEGLFFSAIFTLGGARLKKCFAPLNGEIKPNDYDIRQLLKTYGWLSSDRN